MARIPNRFSGPSLITNAAVTQFTVNAGELAIIRHIHANNTSASAATLTVSIGADAAGTEIFTAFSIAPNAVLDHYCYYTLVAAATVQALSGTTNVINLTISGDRVLLG